MTLKDWYWKYCRRWGKKMHKKTKSDFWIWLSFSFDLTVIILAIILILMNRAFLTELIDACRNESANMTMLNNLTYNLSNLFNSSQGCI